MHKKNIKFKFVLLSFVTVLTISFLLILSLELSFSYFINKGVNDSYPRIALEFFRKYYWFSSYRNIIQYDPNCALYDSGVFYKLRPGVCTHSGARFQNTYYINSLGTRDDDSSLVSPDIISLGDSQTMGWGVNQNETYSQLLEQMSGMSVLNMGVSSYGTARELTFLTRSNLKNVKFIIIQYNDNDFTENRFFVENNLQLKIRSEQIYNDLVRKLAHEKSWIPNTLALLNYTLVQLFRPQENIFDTDSGGADRRLQAQYFLQILKTLYPKKLQNIPIIVFDIKNKVSYRPEDFRNTFASELRTAFNRSDFSGNQLQLTILDISEELNKSPNRHIVDNHLNKTGHELIAKSIFPIIRANLSKK